MVEKDFQRIFGQWVKAHPEIPTTVFELKFVNTAKIKSMRFDAVRANQVEALAQAKHGTLYHKIADQPASWLGGTGYKYTIPKPFDCFAINHAQAFIVIWPYIKGTREGHREMLWVDIDTWMELEQASDKKSIKIQELKQHAQVWLF